MEETKKTFVTKLTDQFWTGFATTAGVLTAAALFTKFKSSSDKPNEE